MTEREHGGPSAKELKSIEEHRQLIMRDRERLLWLRSNLIKRYGEPGDESVWPIAFSGLRDREPGRMYDSLVWLEGHRVIVETSVYREELGETFRSLTDVDVSSMHMLHYYKTDRGESEVMERDLLEEISPNTNIPFVRVAQMNNQLGTMLWSGELSNFPTEEAPATPAS